MAATLPDSELEQIFNVKPRAKPTPGPLGSDIAGVRAVGLALPIVTGRNALAQAILRRLTTPRGGLIGSPEYGYDVLNAIGTPVGSSSDVRHKVLEQVIAEEEVENASVTVTLTHDSLRLSIRVIDGDGPFDLTVTADALTLSALVDGNLLFQESA